MEDLTALLRQHDMSVAYERISEEMGPSAQLIAFVNYGKIDFNNAGLEHLDVDIDHQLTLEEIDNNPAMLMALEGFSDVLQKAKDKLWKLTAIAPKTNLDHYKNNDLVSKKSLHRVVDHKEVIETFNIHNRTLVALDHVLKLLPNHNDTASWEKFYTHQIKDWKNSDLRKQKETLEALQTQFDALGSYLPQGENNWSEADFKYAIGELENKKNKAVSTVKSATVVYANLEKVLQQAEELEKNRLASRKEARASGNHLKINTDEIFPSHVISAMIEVYGVTSRATRLIDLSETYILKSLNITASHFDIKK